MGLLSRLSTTAAMVLALLLPVAAQAQTAPSEALLRARSHCLRAVAKVVGLPPGSLSVIKDQRDGSGFSLDVRVPKATAPWACLTDRQGTVKDVFFKGSEGAL